mgnify:CR=1 FL=1
MKPPNENLAGLYQHAAAVSSGMAVCMPSSDVGTRSVVRHRRRTYLTKRSLTVKALGAPSVARAQSGCGLPTTQNHHTQKMSRCTAPTSSTSETHVGNRRLWEPVALSDTERTSQFVFANADCN